MSEQQASDPRAPNEHGKSTFEVIDLGGPVARIERRSYVTSKWTTLVLMVPADHGNGIPGGSLSISLSEKTLERFLEQLAWPK